MWSRKPRVDTWLFLKVSSSSARLFLDVVQLAAEAVGAQWGEQYGPGNDAVQQPEGRAVEQHLPAAGSTRQRLQIASNREAGPR